MRLRFSATKKVYAERARFGLSLSLFFFFCFLSFAFLSARASAVRQECKRQAASREFIQILCEKTRAPPPLVPSAKTLGRLSYEYRTYRLPPRRH